MNSFRATYADDFEEKALVAEIIKKWNENDPIYTLTTSGSTGTPKEIPLDKTLLIWSANSTKNALNLSPPIAILCCLPVHKTGGFMQLIRALLWDCAIHFVKPTNHPASHFHKSKYTLTSLTPVQLESMVAKNDMPHYPLTILVGGAPVSALLEEQLQGMNLRVFETYGMTETASHIALREIGKDACFKPQNGVNLTPTADGLSIAIPAVNLHVSAQDMVVMLDEGFSVLGRADDVINSGGVKIHPLVIEPLISTVLKSAGIHNPFYLAKKKDKIYGEIAVLVLQAPRITNSAFILELLKRELPAYHHPKEIIQVAAIAYTETGKVIRTPINLSSIII